MRIKTKLVVLVASVVVVLGLMSLIISISSMRHQAKTELEITEATLLTHKKEMLQLVIGNAYAVVETAHKEAIDPEKLVASIQEQLKSAVDIAYGSIQAIAERTDLSDREKQDLAIEMISSTRYGPSDDYFWITTLDLRLIVDPLHEDWQGKDISGLKDINGKPVFPNLLVKAKREKEVYFDYTWMKPGTKIPAPKLAYARVFEPWGWAVGTGRLVEKAEEGIQERAMKIVGSLRYGEGSKEYFWINDMQPRMVMHPISPNLNGSDLSTFKDPDGKRIFVEAVEVCKKDGEGFVEYMWPKPGESKPVPKISFVKYFEPFDWVIGTGIYVDDVHKKIEEKKIELNQRVMANIMKQVIMLVVLCGIILGITIFIASRISKPLVKTSQMLKDIAEGEGDLTQRIDISSKDETGELAKWFNLFVSNLQEMIGKIGRNAESLRQNATDVFGLSREMNSGAAKMSEKTDTVNQSAESMSSNIQSIASAMEQTSTNINLIANSADGMSQTINEIAENTQKAQNICDDAVGQSQLAMENVNQLSTVAHEIGNITEVITEISEQTNLLALNATIEAARAGEAGKGFAVVANEIKELAQQTSDATFKIKNQIGQVQSTSDNADSNIKKIGGVIDEITQIVSTIAAAIEEQSATTKEIAENVNQSSQGLSEINISLAKSTTNATEITDEIADVNVSARDIAEGSSKIDANTENLNRLAQQLNELVGRFKV